MVIEDIMDRVAQIVGIDSSDIVEGSAIHTKLLSAINMVYTELTLQYVHLKTKENIIVVDDRIYYDTLVHPVREILNVSKNGLKLPFSTYPLYIECASSGVVEVTYIYFADELSAGDTVVLPPKFTTYVLALGVTAEYFCRQGLVDEALFYKSRYDNAISNLNIGLKCKNMPHRSFFG